MNIFSWWKTWGKNRKNFCPNMLHKGHDILREAVTYRFVGKIRDAEASNTERLVWVKSIDGQESIVFLSGETFSNRFIIIDGKVLALKKRGPGEKSAPEDGVRVPKPITVKKGEKDEQ